MVALPGDRNDRAFRARPREVAFYAKAAPATPPGLVTRCYDTGLEEETKAMACPAGRHRRHTRLTRRGRYRRRKTDGASSGRSPASMRPGGTISGSGAGSARGSPGEARTSAGEARRTIGRFADRPRRSLVGGAARLYGSFFAAAPWPCWRGARPLAASPIVHGDGHSGTDSARRTARTTCATSTGTPAHRTGLGRPRVHDGDALVSRAPSTVRTAAARPLSRRPARPRRAGL